MLRIAPEVARWIARWRIPRAERHRRKALDSAFNEVKSQAIRFESTNFEARKIVLNIALFFMLAERDIACLKTDALTHPDEWTRKLFARVIILVIYELDLDKVSGRALQDALESIGASDSIRREAVDALRSVRAVQNKVRKEFSFLRNATIGHRDADALLQYRSIRDMNTNRVFQIAGEFYQAAEPFIRLMPRLMLETSSSSSLLKQMAKSGTNS